MIYKELLWLEYTWYPQTSRNHQRAELKASTPIWAALIFRLHLPTSPVSPQILQQGPPTRHGYVVCLGPQSFSTKGSSVVGPFVMIGCFAPRDRMTGLRTYMSTYSDTTRHRPTRSQRRLAVHYPDAEALLVLHMKLQRIRGVMYKMVGICSTVRFPHRKRSQIFSQEAHHLLIFSTRQPLSPWACINGRLPLMTQLSHQLLT